MHLRINRWILSLTELFLPIIVVLGIAKGAENFMSLEGMTHKNATIVPPYSVKNIFTTNHGGFDRIVYTPNAPPLLNLMERYKDYMRKANFASFIHLPDDSVLFEPLFSIRCDQRF